MTHGSLLSKMGSSSDSANKQLRTNSATRYAQGSQKQILTKSQSVEEFKKTQVSISRLKLNAHDGDID